MSLIKRILWYFKPLKTTVANISITAPSRKLAGKRVIVQAVHADWDIT
mgnify:CR=1 FL=1|jgi:3-oxoacyl-[acyl-carrier protein] reductase